MTHATENPASVAQAARIPLDVPCGICGYNLRSLEMTARCPECGNAIADSLRRGRLMFADPAWLGRLRTGITNTLWIVLAVVVLIVAGVAALTFATAVGKNTTLLDAGLLLSGVGFTTIWLFNLRYLTTPEPEPGSTGRARRSRLARWIIGLQLVSVLTYTPYILVMLVILFRSPDSTRAFIATSILGAVSIAFQNLSFFLLLIYMRRIARRETRKGLGKLITFLTWGQAGMAALGVISIGIALKTPVAATPTTAAVFATLGYTPGAPGTASGNPGIALTQPVTIKMTTAAPTPRPPLAFLSGLLSTIAFMVLLQLFVLTWLVCAVVALFWFRSALTRAIRHNAVHLFTLPPARRRAP
ncbi:MAG: hypothetical protein ACE5E1_06610 [Phycisphaerae bacterium]